MERQLIEELNSDIYNSFLSILGIWYQSFEDSSLAGSGALPEAGRGFLEVTEDSGWVLVCRSLGTRLITFLCLYTGQGATSQ